MKAALRVSEVLLASSGVYTAGQPIRSRDIATQYVRLILGVIGITDVAVVAARKRSTWASRRWPGSSPPSNPRSRAPRPRDLRRNSANGRAAAGTGTTGVP